MTAPTTHDTRTVILGDEEIERSAESSASIRSDVHPTLDEIYVKGFKSGARFARSIYEPHVAKLKAEREKLKEDIARMNRGIKFQEDAYLKEHGQWGDCKFRLQVAKLEAEATEAKRLLRRAIERCEELTIGDADRECVEEKAFLALPAAPTQGGGE